MPDVGQWAIGALQGEDGDKVIPLDPHVEKQLPRQIRSIREFIKAWEADHGRTECEEQANHSLGELRRA